MWVSVIWRLLRSIRDCVMTLIISWKIDGFDSNRQNIYVFFQLLISERPVMLIQFNLFDFMKTNINNKWISKRLFCHFAWTIRCKHVAHVSNWNVCRIIALRFWPNERCASIIHRDNAIVLDLAEVRWLKDDHCHDAAVDGRQRPSETCWKYQKRTSADPWVCERATIRPCDMQKYHHQDRH